MTVAVKLDNCAFYVKIRIRLFFYCPDCIIPSLFKMIRPRIINRDKGKSFSIFLKHLEFFSCQQLWMKVAALLSIVIAVFLLLSFWRLLGTNAVNTSSSCCISPRICHRLLVSFFRILISLFLSLWYHLSFWILLFFCHNILSEYMKIVILSLNFFISEPKTKANDNKESKKTLRTENWQKITWTFNWRT